MSHIAPSPATDGKEPRRSDPDPSVTDPHACAVTAISLLNHRQHTWQTIELAVMALRGASLDALLAADRQMTGA